MIKLPWVSRKAYQEKQTALTREEMATAYWREGFCELLDACQTLSSGNGSECCNKESLRAVVRTAAHRLPQGS